LLFIELSFLYNLSITKFKSYNLITFSTPDIDTIDSLFVVRRTDRFANSPNEWWCFLRTDIEPFNPYMFVDSIGLSPGYYYYYTFFTKFTNGNYMKDTLKVPSPSPPQFIYSIPVQGISDGRIFKFVFNAQIDSSSFLNGTDIFSYKYDDTMRYSIRYMRIKKDTIFITTYPLPRSNDNLIIHINSDIVKDIFGNKIDGNWNTLEDGSPYDDVFLNYKIVPLGDFNLDLEVNSSDFIIFRNAFLSGDTYYETGPFSGNLPDLYCIPDGLMDYNDFNSFCIMWKWFINERKIIVEKDEGERIYIEGNKIFTDSDCYIEIALRNGEITDGKSLLSSIKFDTSIYLLESKTRKPVYFTGKIVSYRLYDNDGILIGKGSETFIDKDSSIFDLTGRKNNFMKSGVYFIRKNGVKKIIKIR